MAEHQQNKSYIASDLPRPMRGCALARTAHQGIRISGLSSLGGWRIVGFLEPGAG